MQTDIDDPRLKLMQKWSQETPEYSVGAEALGADEDDDESEEDRDGLSSMFLGPPKGGSKANGKLSTNRTKKQKKRAEEAAKKKKKDEKKKGKGKSHYSEETLLKNKGKSLSSVEMWVDTVWAKLSEPTFLGKFTVAFKTVREAQLLVERFSGAQDADSYLYAYKAIDTLARALRTSNSKTRKPNRRLINITVNRTIVGINRELFDITHIKGITDEAQTHYYAAKLTQHYVEALRDYVKAETKPHIEPPNEEDRRPERAHLPKDLPTDPFHQLTLMETAIRNIFKTFHDTTQKLEHKPASVLRNHNPYYANHSDNDGSHMLMHGTHSHPASGYSSANTSKAPSEAGSVASSRRNSFSTRS